MKSTIEIGVYLLIVVPFSVLIHKLAFNLCNKINLSENDLLSLKQAYEMSEIIANNESS